TASGVDKPYDGSAAASVSYSDDRISGDVLTVGGVAAFDDKNVGTGKNVSVTGINLSGADGGNYAPNATTSTTADITAKALAVTASGVNKPYDGGTAASVNYSDDRVSGDVFTVSGTSAFDDKNAGTGKNVSVTGINLTG